MRKLFSYLALSVLCLFSFVTVYAYSDSIDWSGPHLHFINSYDWHNDGGTEEIQRCGCTPIAVTMADGICIVLSNGCMGGSGGGGSSGPPTLTDMTQADFEDLIRRTFTQDGVKVKVEDLQGQVSQAVLDALNQGVTYQ